MLARDSIMTVEKQGSSETEGSRRLTGDSTEGMCFYTIRNF